MMRTRRPWIGSAPVLALLVTLAACRAPEPAAPASWAIIQRPEGDIEVRHGDLPLFSYRWRPKLAPGVPEAMRRSTYVYPLRDPQGVDVLDDFPADHRHHRGISWMWPVVLIDGQRHDLWLLQGIEQRFEAVEGQTTSGGRASLSLRNGWYTGDRRVVAETVTITATGMAYGHVLDFDFSWEAVDRPVTLGGQPDGNKGYGGFGVRFAPHGDVVITTSSGAIAKDSLHERYSWVDYSSRFRGAEAVSGVAVIAHPANDGFPNEWICRFYGYVGECWPGLGRVVLEPRQPRTARYRVYVHSGSAEAAQVADVAAAWGQ